MTKATGGDALLRFFVSFVVLAISLAAPAAFADSNRMGLTMTSPSSGQLKAKQLYVVEITCRPLKDLKGAIRQSAFGLIKTTETSSHLLMVSAKRPTVTAGKTALPDAALYSGIIFAINTADVLDLRSKCNDYFFISGGKPYFLTVVENYSKAHEPGQAISILKNGIKLAQPLFTLFGAGELSAAVQPLLTAVTSAETPYKDLLAELNKGENYTKSEPLVPGKYQISTQYSAETVTVREIASAVTDQNTSFTALLDQQLDATNTRMQPPASHAVCNPILSDLNKLGFYSPTDQGYALVQLAFRGGITKDDLLKNCLPFEAAMATARLGNFFWKGIPSESRFTVPDVQNAFPVPPSQQVVSPSFDAVVPSVASFIDAGNQILRRDEAPAAAVAKANDVFADKIALADNTNDVLFGSSENKSPLDVLLQLKSGGVTRLGCYVQTSGATDAASDGAVVILLGFVIPLTAKEAGPDDAITIRPIFAKGKIASLSISKNRAWIDAVLTNRTSCNELKIKK